MKRIAAVVVAGVMGAFLMACSEQPKQPEVKIENHPVTTPAQAPEEARSRRHQRTDPLSMARQRP